MRICILSSFEDSLSINTGYSVRIYNLSRGLAKLGNEVHVIIPGFITNTEKVSQFLVHKFSGLLPKKMLLFLAKLLGIAKPTALYFYDPFFVFRIRKLIRDADIVQIEQQTAGALIVPITVRVWKKPVVVDCHDVFQSLRVKHTLKVRQILETFFEILVYKYASLILVVSEMEKKILASCGVMEEKIRVTPNGVDIEEFANLVTDFANVRRSYDLGNHRIVVFVGNMEYPPNREAVELIATKIAPIVCKEVDNVKFLIIGRYLERINSPNLIFTGTVEDVFELLAISDVAIAPLFRGSGTRLKILEYLACGLPVISTTKGVEGLNLKNGISVIIEDDLNEFAKSIVKLLKNPELAEKFRRNAKKSIVDYDWKKISAKLNKTYEEFLQKKSAEYPTKTFIVQS